MRAFTRYVLFQLFGISLVALTVVTLLIVIGGVAMQARNEGLNLAQIARLVPYILPDALRFAVPATVLFATSFVFGRMASANEVVALKSMGISPWSVLWPVLVAAVFVSFAAVWMNDLAVSWGRRGVRRVVIESIEEVAYRTLESQKSYSNRRFSITVRDVVDRRLIRPTITFRRNRDSEAVVIRAEWAELAADLEQETLTLLLHNGSAVGGGVVAKFPGTIERVLPLTDASKTGGGSWNSSRKALHEISGAIASEKTQIEQVRERLAARAGFEMLSGEFDSLLRPAWREAQADLVNRERSFARLLAEPHRRWANGFSCLCFVLVGAPLAMRMRKAEFWTSFFVCFLPILLVYYPLLQYSVGEAKVGALPPYSVWLGNLILACWGVWLLRRVIRY